MNSLLHFLWPAAHPLASYAAWLAAEPRTAQRRDQCPGATPPFFFLSITPFGVTEPARKRRRPKGSTAGCDAGILCSALEREGLRLWYRSAV